MEVGPIGSFSPSTPPNRSVDVGKVSKGPDLPYATHADPSFGGPDNDKVLSMLLNVTQSEGSTMTQSRLMAQVSQLETLKQERTPDALLQVADGYLKLMSLKGEASNTMGIFGLLSLLKNPDYGPTRAKIAEMMMVQLLPHVDTPEFKLFAQPLFEGLLPFVPEIPPEVIHPFPVQIFKSGLMTEQPHLQPLLDQFVSTQPAVVTTIEALSPQLVAPLAFESVPPPPQSLPTEPLPTLPSPYRLNLGVFQEAVRTLRANMVQMAWPLLAFDPLLLTQVLMLDVIGRRVNRQHRRARFSHIAVVTHPSAAVSSELMNRYPIYQVAHDPDNYLRIFHDLFVSLVQSGFDAILVVLPNGDYWHSVHHARHAMAGVRANIRVVDSHLFGLGLGLLVREVANLLPKVGRVDELESRLSRLASRIHYWMVPFNVNMINAHFWYQKMKRGVRMSGASVPIISFSDAGGIVAAAESPTAAVMKMEQVVTDFLHTHTIVPRVIVIEHHDALAVAKGLGVFFQRAYPKVRVVMQAARPFMVTEIGPFVGVVAL